MVNTNKEATIINLHLDNEKNSTLNFEHNGKQHLCISVDADLYLNKINTYASSIKATFKNNAPAKTMIVAFDTTS